MSRVALVALVAFALGAAVGAVVWGRMIANVVITPPGSAMAAPEGTTPAACPPPVERVVYRTAPSPGAAPALPPPAPPREIPSDPVALRAEVERLRADLAATRAQLDETRQVDVAKNGEALTPPPNLAPRFSQETLRTAMTAALAEAGMTGSITSVDCTEYPCIIYGEGKGGPEEFKRLLATNALRPYVDDSSSASGWGMGDGTPEHPRRDFLGLALYPRDDSKARGEQIRQRLKYRESEMVATFERQ